MRVISLFVAGFLFFASLEAWASYWLLGRWYVSSRFAALSLGTAKNWLDRGIINRGTEWAKVFINRNGKLILLTLGLSQVIREIESLQQTNYCLAEDITVSAAWTSWDTPSIHADQGGYYWTATRVSGQGCYMYGQRVPIPGVMVRTVREGWQHARIPKEGTYQVGNCVVRITWLVSFPPCSVARNPQEVLQQKRRVPVRAYPNPVHFLRDDVINNDPALRWLRDEYNRIASDNSIPTIPSDALGDVKLPSVEWSISPDEALDFPSERGSTRDNARDNESSQDASQDVPLPGLDTNIPSIEKRPFPVELINSLVQNHPLLRILSNLNFDAGSGGSCVIGSGVFIIDFCDHAWVLNLMGAIIVPVAFIVGFIGWRNE